MSCVVAVNRGLLDSHARDARDVVAPMTGADGSGRCRDEKSHLGNRQS